MSVMTCDIFADICEQIWGDRWKPLAAERLQRSERQLRKIAANESNVSRQLRDDLMSIVRDQIAVLQAFEREYS